MSEHTAEKDQQPGQRSTCLVPVWDGPYRMRCSMGTNGVCAKHGPHEPHSKDGRACDPNPSDGYCHAHGVYVRNPPARLPDCTCSAGNGLPFPAQHATLCPRFACGRTDVVLPPERTSA